MLVRTLFTYPTNSISTVKLFHTYQVRPLASLTNPSQDFFQHQPHFTALKFKGQAQGRETRASKNVSSTANTTTSSTKVEQQQTSHAPVPKEEQKASQTPTQEEDQQPTPQALAQKSEQQQALQALADKMEKQQQALQALAQKLERKSADTDTKLQRLPVLYYELNDQKGGKRLCSLREELFAVNDFRELILQKKQAQLEALRKPHPQLVELHALKEEKKASDWEKKRELRARKKTLIQQIEIQGKTNKALKRAYQEVKKIKAHLKPMEDKTLSSSPRPVQELEAELEANSPELYKKYLELNALQNKMDEGTEVIRVLKKRQQKIRDVLLPLVETNASFDDPVVARLYDTFHDITQALYPTDKNVTAYKAAKKKLMAHPLYPEVARCYDEKEFKELTQTLTQLRKDFDRHASKYIRATFKHPSDEPKTAAAKLEWPITDSTQLDTILDSMPPEQITEIYDKLFAKHLSPPVSPEHAKLEKVNQRMEQAQHSNYRYDLFDLHDLRHLYMEMLRLRKKAITSENGIRVRNKEEAYPELHAERTWIPGNTNLQLTIPRAPRAGTLKRKDNPNQDAERQNVDKGIIFDEDALSKPNAGRRSRRLW